jgi:hypothetical protein
MKGMMYAMKKGSWELGVRARGRSVDQAAKLHKPRTQLEP